jgi:hypothetical protein
LFNIDKLDVLGSINSSSEIEVVEAEGVLLNLHLVMALGKVLENVTETISVIEVMSVLQDKLLTAILSLLDLE